MLLIQSWFLFEAETNVETNLYARAMLAMGSTAPSIRPKY